MNKKNSYSIMKLIDFVTEKLTVILKKIGKLISNKKTHDTVYIFSKLIVTIVFLFVVKIGFDFVNIIVSNLIYMVGSTFRSILNFISRFMINTSYLIFCFVILLKVFDSVLNDKTLNFIEDNKRKDTKLKKQVFNPLINLSKTFLNILTIPFALIIVLSVIAIGANIALLTHGYIIIGSLIVLIGIGLMCLSTIMLIKKIIGGQK